MAVSKEDIKSSYPLPVYNYRVEIGSDAVAFSEVSGLSISYETTTYKESPVESGKPGPRVMTMPAQRQAPTITLKKGLVPAVSMKVLYEWIKGIQTNQIEKKDINVSLCNENGEAVVTWKISNAFPTKLEGPTLDANSNDVALETMELMADGISIAES
ncbi:MAG: phage tail protein [Gammaproteobacteria bacterium]